jgi:hypothetical protein
MSSLKGMTPSQIKELARFVFQTNLKSTRDNQSVIMLTGAPGIGKTAIGQQLADELFEGRIYKSHPSVEDPTDTKGLPWPSSENDSATFIPIGVVSKLLKEDKPCLWLIDDFGQAPPSVQVAYMQWLHGKELNGHKLGDNVQIMICTNRTTDMANVYTIPEPVKSRTIIIPFEFALDEWVNWAINEGLPYEIIAFAKYRPALFESFKPTKELVNQMTPRTFARAAHLYQNGLPSHLWFPVFSGAIGEGPANELTAFLELIAKLPDPDYVLLNPETADVPDQPSTRFAMTGALAKAVKKGTMENALAYIKRWQIDGKETKEYQFLFITELKRLGKEECIKTNAFIQWAIKSSNLLN